MENIREVFTQINLSSVLIGTGKKLVGTTKKMTETFYSKELCYEDVNSAFIYTNGKIYELFSGEEYASNYQNAIENGILNYIQDASPLDCEVHKSISLQKLKKIVFETLEERKVLDESGYNFLTSSGVIVPTHLRAKEQHPPIKSQRHVNPYDPRIESVIEHIENVDHLEYLKQNKISPQNTNDLLLLGVGMNMHDIFSTDVVADFKVPSYNEPIDSVVKRKVFKREIKKATKKAK